MKKLYYAVPFAGVPGLLLLCNYLARTGLLSMSVYIVFAVLLLFSAGMGYFSPTEKTFDYLLSAVMPLALFCCMFVVGFLDKSDLETRFHLYIALRAAFQPPSLILAVLMAAAAFAASFRGVRRSRKNFRKK